MPARFVQDSAALLSAKFVSNGCLSAAAIIMARALPPSARGTVVLLITMSGLAVLLGSLGLTIVGVIRLTRPDDDVDLASYWGLIATLSTAQLVLCSTAALLVARTVDGTISLTEISLTAVYGSASLAALLLLTVLYSKGHVVAGAWNDVVGSAAQLLGVLALFVLGSEDRTAYLAVMTLGWVAQVAVSLLLLARRALVAQPRFSWTVLRSLRRDSPQALVITLTQGLAFKLDRYLIGLLIGPAAVGIYSVGATASESLRLLPYAVSQVAFFRGASDRRALSTRFRLHLGVSYLALLLVLFVVAGWGIPTLVGDAYRAAITPMRIMLLAELPLAWYLVMAGEHMARGQLGRAASASAAGLAVGAMCDLLLVPTWGLNGAALAAVVSYAVMALALASSSTTRSHDAVDIDGEQVVAGVRIGEDLRTLDGSLGR